MNEGCDRKKVRDKFLWNWEVNRKKERDIFFMNEGSDRKKVRDKFLWNQEVNRKK